MVPMHWRRVLLALSPVFIAALAVASPAAAGSFSINPVSLAVAPNRTTTSASLANGGTEPVSVRVLVYRWTQEDGVDVRRETTDVIVSPPIFTLAPGAAQLVRMGVKDRRAGESFRVVFEEISRPEPVGNMVQVALRLDLPLHVEAADGAPDLTWQAWRGESGAMVLEAVNTGTRHQRVLAIHRLEADETMAALSEETGVVLPAGSRRWDIGDAPGFAAGSAVTLIVRTPQGEEQQTVAVQQR